MRTTDNPTLIDGLSPRNRAIFARGVRGAADADHAGRLAEITAILSGAETRAALTDVELGELETELRALADAILDGSAEGIERNDTERLTEVAVAIESVRTEAAERLAAAEASEAEVAEIMARIRAEDTDADETEADDAAEGEGDADAEGDDEDEDIDAEENTTVVEVIEADEPVLVTASAAGPPSLSELARRVPTANRATRRQASRGTGLVLARSAPATVRAIERGEDVSIEALAELMIERWDDFAGMAPGRGAEKIRIGRISIGDRFSDEMTLRGGDNLLENDAKMEAVMASAMLPSSWTDESLVASGGFCAATPADYEVLTISGAQRPLRDSLPRFLADRGGIRYTPPASLADILVDQSGGAVGEWSNVTDITPGESVKTCQHISCEDPVEVVIKAIYRCLEFGNFGNRAFPEWVRAWTLNAAAAWARKGESEILDGVSAGSTAVTSTGIYGYIPELLTHIIQLSYGERSRQRMDQTTRLRVWLPSWVPGQFQIDRLRQGSVESRVMPEAEIRAMFAAANVNVTWYDDSRTGAGQIVGAQAAGVELRDLPEIVEWYLFHEGAWQFLDGGTLDLGVVRDSTLNETNDFRIFAENFEEVAFRGHFSYRVRSTLCPNGERSALLDGDPCGAS